MAALNNFFQKKKNGQNDKLTGTPEAYLQTGTVPIKPRRMVRLSGYLDISVVHIPRRKYSEQQPTVRIDFLNFEKAYMNVTFKNLNTQ